jgi:4-amino-4-deoxy-L-arabinose transferase-like glycosyltransferase
MTEGSGRAAAPKLALPLIMLTALGLRLLHIFSSVDNPFLYALSPDELYYLDFARDVLGGGWGLGPGLNFMDPLYGYLLGSVMWVTGDDLFLVRVLQAGVDTFSVYLIYRVGCELAAPRAGLLAAAAYAICGTAIFYSGLLLKTTWVASFCLLWVLLLLRGERRGLWFWLGIGAFVSLCVLLRSPLLLLAPASVAWIAWRDWQEKRRLSLKLLAFGAGLMLVMSLSALRQQEITDQWQWLPSNGGINLYQVYNPQYAATGRVMPDFVLSLNPREMQFYFVREAERRTGRPMSLSETNAYFSAAALEHMRENPGAVVKHLMGNLVSFFGGYEPPINRSYYVDRLYSSILQLPLAGFSLLLALGGIGLVFAVRGDARSLVLWIPVSIALITYTVFFDFSRFRFPAVPMLAVGAGVLLDWLWRRVDEKRWKPAGLVAGLACGIFLASAALGWRSGNSSIDEQQLANAQVKAGQFEQAEATITKALESRPDSAALYELLGIIAARRNDLPAAIEFNRRALALDAQRHVAWYNLSVAYNEPADQPRALEAIRAAISLRSLPDYRYRLALLLEQEEPETSRRMYNDLLDELAVDSPLRENVGAGLERLPGL